MVDQLLINVFIFISFLYFAGILLRREEKSSAKTSLVIGVFAGMLGLTLMHFSITLPQHTIVDLRHLATVTTAVYVGWVPALISAVIIIFGRIIMFGVTESAIVASIGMITIAIVSALLTRSSLRNLPKLQLMNSVSLLIIVMALLKNIGFSATLEIFPYHLVISLLAGFIAYFIAEQMKRTNEQYRFLEKSATKDFLTDLNNVRQFDVSYNQALKHANEKNEKLSVLLIDIDHFKKVNDTYGHAAGDEVLRELGKVLKTQARSFDILSRNGGEEFSVLLLDCPHDHALTIAERIRSAVEIHPFVLNNHQTIHITISIGVATFPDTVSANSDELFEQADKALYLAKRTGRNKVCNFEMVKEES